MTTISDKDLICPICRLPLKQVRTTHGVFWACGHCGGRAITVELLRRTFTPESINPLWLHAIQGAERTGPSCPSCRNSMTEVKLSDNAAVKVDVCRPCHFVWFDAKEVENLVPRPAPAPKPELPQEAREAKAMFRVEQLAQQAEGSDWASESPDELWKQIAGFFGLPVEFDEEVHHCRPWATWLLSAAIVIVSIIGFLHYDSAIRQWGLIPAQFDRAAGATFVTSFFLHGGILHLIGNLYFLLIFGDNVEAHLGRMRYLGLIVFAAFAGDLAHILLDPRSELPCIGASGGISGLITYYALKFPQARLGFAWRFWLYLHWFRLPAWFALVLWVLLQVVGVLQQVAGFTKISAIAHLGGAAVGFLAWIIWRSRIVAGASDL